MSHTHLSASINNIPANNLHICHHIIHRLQLTKTDNLVRALDKPTGEEVDSFLGILSVADVAALNLNHLDDRTEHGGLDISVRGQANADNGTEGADVVGSLLEWTLRHSKEDNSVGAKAVRTGSLHICDDILGLGEIDKCLSTELLASLFLRLTAIDSNGMETHGLGVLKRHVTETATGTNNGDSLAGAGMGLLQTLVHGDTGTEHGRNGLERNLLGNAGDMSGLGNGILLEAAVDGVTGEKRLGAEGLMGLPAVCAVQAGTIEPLDARVVTNLNIVDQLAPGDNDTGALVTADKGNLGRERPIAHYSVEICVAHAGVLDVDEDFIGAGLLNGNLLVDDG